MLFGRLPGAVNWPALVVLLGAVLLAKTAPASAGILDATWTAPTTNTDGSPLTDLASYRVYYGTSPASCPGPSFASVASATSRPTQNQSVTYRLTGLATGTLYYVAVTALDSGGNESGCSVSASAAARSEFDVSPSGTVNFGSVNLGSSAEQAFTASNTAGGTVSGSATVPPPFSIASGSPFTLTGAGATQTVTVRFTPTTVATVSATVSFTANGGTVTRVVIGAGSGSGSDATKPSIAITSPSTLASFTRNATFALAGTASDNVSVTQVTWTNNRGGSGTATGTTSWSVSGISLQTGSNLLTVTARDAAGNASSATLTVWRDRRTP